MSIWNKVLLGCIFVATLVMILFASKALIIKQRWSQEARQLKADLTAEEEKIRELNRWDEGSEMTLHRAQVELHKLTVDRGRVWSNCNPVEIQKDAQTGALAVKVALDPAVTIDLNTVLFVFEDKPVKEGGHYLGQFAVVASAAGQAGLQPRVNFTAAELGRLQQSQKAGTRWILYDVMPIDDHEILAGLSDDEKKAMFPKATVAEYLADGQITTKEEVERQGLSGKVLMVDEAGQPVLDAQGLETEVQQGKGKYVRQLRDYDVLFSELIRLRSNTLDKIAATDQDKSYLERAVLDAKQQQQFRRTEIDSLHVELAETTRQRDEVNAHRDALAGAIASMQKAIANLMESNRAVAGKIARIQYEAARIIDARTQGMAQAEGAR